MREIRISKQDYFFCVHFITKLSQEQIKFVKKHRQLPQMELTIFEQQKLTAGFQPIVIAGILAGPGFYQNHYL
jgi:hypothetical protein